MIAHLEQLTFFFHISWKEKLLFKWIFMTALGFETDKKKNVRILWNYFGSFTYLENLTKSMHFDERGGLRQSNPLLLSCIKLEQKLFFYYLCEATIFLIKRIIIIIILMQFQISLVTFLDQRNCLKMYLYI